jgi:bacterioferritin
VEKQALIDALNQDLANEYSAIIQYTQYSAKVRGPWRTELRQFFQAEIPDEQMHAQYLADKIAAMGGNPTTQPAPVRNADSAEDMLKAVRDAEADAVRRYTERSRQADEMGEIALKVQLENFISDEQTHMQEVEQILAEWPVRA